MEAISYDNKGNVIGEWRQYMMIEAVSWENGGNIIGE